MTSPFHDARVHYQPKLPELLKEIEKVELVLGEKTEADGDIEKLKMAFPKTFGQPIAKFKKGSEKKGSPLKVGAVFSGGQAAGGHNVIIGLFDALKKINEKSTLLGFLGGPEGILKNQFKELSLSLLQTFRNTGGFDLIGSGRTKIETNEQFEAALKNCKNLDLDGLIVIGGDDSNTNAALLAEYFLEKGCKTSVVGVPKTIDGDLKNEWVETSFGFDTATKVYSELISNICRDALSAKKYTHFIKLMGRSASHITLECALQTQPNVALIGEEIAQKKMTIEKITHFLADVVEKRSALGKNYGVILIPEGVIEFVPEMKTLIKELNSLIGNEEKDVIANLSESSKKTFNFLPKKIQDQLLLDRDPHGNVQVSQIASEELFLFKVQEELKKRNFKGKFSPLNHFFGYEGRSGFPSNFDATYCYSLGFVAASLVNFRKTGYMCSLQKLKKSPQKWEASGLPLTMMMNLETRKGKEKPVIKKALVNLEGKPFKKFSENRDKWSLEDQFRFIGPIQFFGLASLSDETTLTLKMEQFEMSPNVSHRF